MTPPHPAMALSTMLLQRWPGRDGAGRFMRAARTLGFGAVELSHILPGAQVDELAALARQPGMPAIRTLHHPCPRPAGWGDGMAFTSARAERREAAWLAALATVERAAHLGARAVVMHLGSLEDDAPERRRRLAFELDSRWRAGQRDGAPYRAALARLLEWCREREGPALDRALPYLDRLAARAASLGVTVGLETGFHLHELPSPEGMRRLLDVAARSGWSALGAWLDTGHVGVRAALGGPGWDAWWAAVGHRWVGAHLHDLVGLRDHLLPGMGEVDFRRVRELLPTSAEVTLEIDWYFSAAEIRRSLRHLADTGWEPGGVPRQRSSVAGALGG